jgi:serine/threonine protein kinase
LHKGRNSKKLSSVFVEGDGGQSVVQNDGRLAAQMGPGTQVNRIYRLVRLLGAGGMGEVWEARHERTRGRVAIKILLPEIGRDRELLRRFQREVEITSDLNHPNIVRVSDADKLPDGRPFLVMEFLEGQDLAAYAAGQRLGFPRVIDIVEQAAMGLHAAHSRSVIHRDLKPANLFIVPLPGLERPLVKILDFGISKALDGLSKLTKTRSLMGTPDYMAPEQATGGVSSMDARADQFALAAIAYELLAGRRAFEGDGMVNVLYKVLNEWPPSLASVGATAPRAVEDAVLKGLSKSPEGRFGTVLEFSQALKRGAETGLPGIIFKPSRLEAEVPTPIVQSMPSTPVVPTIGGTTGQIEPLKDSPELSPSARGWRPLRSGKNTSAFMVASATVVLLAVFLSVAALSIRTRNSRKEFATLSSVEKGAAGLYFAADRPSASGKIHRVPVLLQSHPEGAAIFVTDRLETVGVTPMWYALELDENNPPRVMFRKVGFADKAIAVDSTRPATVELIANAPPPAIVPSPVQATGGGLDGARSHAAQRMREPYRLMRGKPTAGGHPTVRPEAVHLGQLGESAGPQRRLPGAPSSAGGRSTPVQAEPSAGTSYELKISSKPAGGEVSLDGNPVGRTPLSVSVGDLASPHFVTIRKEGFELFEEQVKTSSAWIKVKGAKGDGGGASTVQQLRLSPKLKALSGTVGGLTPEADGPVGEAAPKVDELDRADRSDKTKPHKVDDDTLPLKEAIVPAAGAH